MKIEEELSKEFSKAAKKTIELGLAMIRQEAGQICPWEAHEWRCRQTLIGGNHLIRDVALKTGYKLKIPGYHIFQCICCSTWSISDYADADNPLGALNANVAHDLAFPAYA